MPSSANFADAFYTVVPLFMFVMKAFFIIDRYLVQKICFSFGSFSADKHIEDIIQNIASLPPPTKRREEDMPKSTKTIERIIVSGGPVGHLSLVVDGTIVQLEAITLIGMHH